MFIYQWKIVRPWLQICKYLLDISLLEFAIYISETIEYFSVRMDYKLLYKDGYETLVILIQVFGEDFVFIFIGLTLLLLSSQNPAKVSFN